MNRRPAFFFPLLALAGTFVPSSLAQEVRKATLPFPERIATPPAIAAPTPPLPASTAAPVFIGPPVKMRLWNFTGRGVEAVWMKSDGTEQSRGLVPPSQPGAIPAMIDTFGGQLWQFKADGRVLQVFAAKNDAVQDVRIGQPQTAALPPVDPAPAQIRVEDGLILQDPIPAAIPVVPLPIPTLSPEMEDAPLDARDFLRIHNEERARVGVRPLRWSAKLAKYAQQWAEHLASTGQFEHRDPSQAKYGENLFRGANGYSPLDAVRLWLDERSHYRGGSVPRRDLKTVGHYTQMVWRETTEVGYGVAYGPDGLIVVANYSPGGNQVGRKPY